MTVPRPAGAPPVPNPTQVTLDVIGNCSGAPGPGSACAGYVLRYGSTNLVLDLGPSAIANLRLRLNTNALDGIVISHMHLDHWLDVLVLNVALQTGGFDLQPGTSGRRIPIYLPPGGAETVDAAFRALTVNVTGGSAGRYRDVLDLHEYDPGATVVIGDARIEFVGPTKHSTLCYGMRVELGGLTVGYTGDSAKCEAAIACGQNADVFLAECTLMQPGPHSDTHMSAAETGEVATLSGCRRLLATHILHSDEAWRERLLAGVRSTYAGDVDLVRPRESYVLASDHPAPLGF